MLLSLNDFRSTRFLKFLSSFIFSSSFLLKKSYVHFVKLVKDSQYFCFALAGKSTFQESQQNDSKKSKKSRKSAAKEDEDSDEEEVSKEEYEVARIVDVHFKQNGEREFLVRWKGYSAKEETWEPESHLNCKHLIDAYLKKCEEVCMQRWFEIQAFYHDPS